MEEGSGAGGAWAARPLPQGMMRVKADEFGRFYTHEAGDVFVAKALEIQAELGSREANRYLLEKLGTDLSFDFDEGYFAEALNYHLALLHAHSQRPERMAECIAKSKTMPTSEDNKIFSDHVTLSLVTREHQQHAIGRKIPAFLFACMPQSASATITHSLAKLLDIPILHVTMGRFPEYFLAPAWLEMFLEGGAITQDHFPANSFNAGVLGDRGKLDVFVTVRDPRAAARSAVHHALRSGIVPPDELEKMIAKECMTSFIPWLQGWIAAAQNTAAPYNVHWVTFQDIKSDLPAVARRVCSTMQESGHPVLEQFTNANVVEEVRVHYVTGDDASWRSEVGDKVRGELWEACTPEIRCWRWSRNRAPQLASCRTRSPASARSISSLVFSTPYSSMNPPKRGPWDWPSSTS